MNLWRPDTEELSPIAGLKRFDTCLKLLDPFGLRISLLENLSLDIRRSVLESLDCFSHLALEDFQISDSLSMPPSRGLSRENSYAESSMKFFTFMIVLTLGS